MSKSIHMTASQYLTSSLCDRMFKEHFPKLQMLGSDLTRDDQYLGRWSGEYADFVWEARTIEVDNEESGGATMVAIKGRVRLHRQNQARWEIVHATLTDGTTIYLYGERARYEGSKPYGGNPLSIDFD